MQKMMDLLDLREEEQHSRIGTIEATPTTSEVDTHTSSPRSTKRKHCGNGEDETSCMPSSAALDDSALQGHITSNKRRRRYMRRGSKVSSMLFALPYQSFGHDLYGLDCDEDNDGQASSSSSSTASSQAEEGRNRVVAEPGMPSRFELLNVVQTVSTSLSMVSTARSELPNL